MAFSDNWVDKRDWTPSADGDLVKAEDINSIAHAVIENEESFSDLYKRIVQANVIITQLQTEIANLLAEKADKQTEAGGFAAGEDAAITDDTPGVAIGKGAEAISPYVVDSYPELPHQTIATISYGVAIGTDSHAGGGAAIGNKATTNGGGSVGMEASTGRGGSVGIRATSTDGGAVGYNAKAGYGFAGGYGAQAVNEDGAGINAIQLGTGTNSTLKTLKVYNYQLMDADGNIPAERLKNAPSGGGGSEAMLIQQGEFISGGAIDDTAAYNTFLIENSYVYTGQGPSIAITTDSTSRVYKGTILIGSEDDASANSVIIGNADTYSVIAGTAIGYNVKIRGSNGIAIGVGATIEDRGSDGIAIGANATVSEENAIAIGSLSKATKKNAIQLGEGTNEKANTFQVFGYTLLDDEGHIPLDRIVLTDQANGSKCTLTVNNGVVGVSY